MNSELPLNEKIQHTFQLAFDKHQNGLLSEAYRLYSEVLVLEPDHFDALHLSGLVAYQTDNPDLAVTFISKALEIKASDPSLHNNLGIALHALGRYERALECYQTAQNLKPDYIEAFYNAGNASYEKGDLAIAANYYESALSIDPSYVDAHLNLGKVFYDLKKLDFAIACFDLAISFKPDSATGFFYRGMAFEGQGHLNLALLDYERALIFQPDHLEAQQKKQQIQNLPSS